MDFKRNKVELTTSTKDLQQFDSATGNIYETTAILARRSNQIAQELKEELNAKLQEFASAIDNLEEVFENREQIEIAKHYENLPKPHLIALHEFVNGQIYWRNLAKES